MADRADHSDPMWDARRKRLDRSLFSSGAMMFMSMLQGADMAAVVVPAGFIFWGLAIGAYFGAAEYGRVHGGTTVVTEEVEPGPPKTVTTTIEKQAKPEPEGE